jgi:hypothetical protein
MTPRIAIESVVGARFIVPASPRRGASVVLKRAHEDVFFDSQELAFALLSVRVKALQLASEASVSASTSVPRAISWGDAYSSGRWLYPFRQGINNIATGTMRDMKSES